MRGSSIVLLTSLLGGGGLLGACATSETTDSGSAAPEDAGVPIDAGADGDADADLDGDVDGDADDVDSGLPLLVDAGPAVETCNGEDDDGDGAIDEDDPEGGLLCQTRLAGDCRIGDTRCIDGALVCVGRVPPGVETCGNPGRDDDCDGTADDIDELGDACVSDEPGICAPGTVTCDGADLVCMPDLAPRPEVCFDGIDDDCSGVADDGIVLAAETCRRRRPRGEHGLPRRGRRRVRAGPVPVPGPGAVLPGHRGGGGRALRQCHRRRLRRRGRRSGLPRSVAAPHRLRPDVVRRRGDRDLRPHAGDARL
jgi:hypothetical protein